MQHYIFWHISEQLLDYDCDVKSSQMTVDCCCMTSTALRSGAVFDNCNGMVNRTLNSTYWSEDTREAELWRDSVTQQKYNQIHRLLDSRPVDWAWPLLLLSVYSKSTYPTYPSIPSHLNPSIHYVVPNMYSKTFEQTLLQSDIRYFSELSKKYSVKSGESRKGRSLLKLSRCVVYYLSVSGTRSVNMIQEQRR